MYLAASLAYTALIWALSSRSDSGGMGVPAPWDKLAHAAEYGILAGLLYGGLLWTRRPWALCWVLATLFGAGDELHQGLVPGRDASVWDFLADAAGAMAAVALVHAVRARRPKDRFPAEGVSATATRTRPPVHR